MERIAARTQDARGSEAEMTASRTSAKKRAKKESEEAETEPTTVTCLVPQMRAKKVGRSVLCTVTVTCGLVANAAAPSFGKVTTTATVPPPTSLYVATCVAIAIARSFAPAGPAAGSPARYAAVAWRGKRRFCGVCRRDSVSMAPS